LEENSVVVSPQKAAIVMPAKLKQIECHRRSDAFILRTTQSDLLHHFEKLVAWHHRGSLVFDYSIDLNNGPGAMLRQMMNYLFYELNHNDLVLKNPGLRKSYDHLLP